MKITEKAAYIKGLLEGLSLDPGKPETKIITAVVETLGQMAAEVSALSDEAKRFSEYLDELDQDLGELETDYYFSDEEELGELDALDDLEDYDDGLIKDGIITNSDWDKWTFGDADEVGENPEGEDE